MSCAVMKFQHLLLVVMLLLLVLPGLAAGKRETNLLPGVKRIFFVGDSFTDAAAWPYWMVETLKAHGSPDLVVHNAAVCGSSMTTVRARYEKDVLDLYPDMVVISTCTNDASPAGLETFRQDIAYLINSARKAGAKRVLLMTRPPAKNGMGEVFVTNNQVIREVGKQYNCPVAEVYTAFVEAMKAGKTVICPDGLHPTADGWRLMGRTALDALGCTAPMIETIPLYPQAIVDWRIGPGVKWNPKDPVPDEILAPAFDLVKAGWKSYDLAAAQKQSNDVNLCNYQLGGIDPMLTSTTKDATGAFAVTTIHSSKARDIVLHISDFPSLYIWLNGKPIWTNDNHIHGLHPDAARIPIHLQRGENRLVVFSNQCFFVSLGDI